MYLYVHIPFCKSKCSYCDFFSLPIGSGAVSDSYIDALLAEAAYKKKLHRIKNWTTVYIGGGTPSLLSAFQLKKLCTGLFALCPPAGGAEITLEVNCADIAEKNARGFSDYLENASAAGVNRISAGIQSLDGAVLRCIGRRSSASETVSALENLRFWRAAGKGRRFSCDLIAGLPLLGNQKFKEGLLQVLFYAPDHLSLYSLMIEKGTELEHKISSGALVWDADCADEQWLEGKKLLEDSGYIQYEVSNFAKKGFESRHNCAYWRMEDYEGIGAGAVGTVRDFRYANTKDIASYTAFWTDEKKIFRSEISRSEIPQSIRASEHLSEKDRILEFLMMGFRMREGISSREFYRRFSIPLEDVIGKVFSRWAGRGLAEKCGEQYRLNAKGILFLNDFLTELG